MTRFKAAAVLSFLFLSLTVFLGSAQAEKLVYSKSPLLSGEFCVPDGPGPFPAVVYNHGGEGYSKSGLQSIGGDPSATCEALAKAGFVGFSPIRRPKAEWKVHVQDIMAAVEAVKAHKAVDPDKIALMGFSSGGLVGLLTAVRQRDLKALVIMAAATNQAMKKATEKFSHIRAPILLLVAENDTGSKYTKGVNVAAGMRSLDADLKKMGKDSTLIVYPRFGLDGHSMFFEIGNYWKDVVSFLKRHFEASISSRAPAPQGGPSPQKALNRMDSNGDGLISRKEWKGPPPAFARIDTNADGFLEFDELKRWFDRPM